MFYVIPFPFSRYQTKCVIQGMVRWKNYKKLLDSKGFLTLSVIHWIYFQLHIYCLTCYLKRPLWANFWAHDVSEEYVQMKWKINKNVKEHRRKLVKDMHVTIYAKSTFYQEKRKCLILISVIMNYLILKMMRTETMEKLLKSWKH